jgi:hypothetical protein
MPPRTCGGLWGKGTIAITGVGGAVGLVGNLGRAVAGVSNELAEASEVGGLDGSYWDWKPLSQPYRKPVPLAPLQELVPAP